MITVYHSILATYDLVFLQREFAHFYAVSDSSVMICIHWRIPRHISSICERHVRSNATYALLELMQLQKPIPVMNGKPIGLLSSIQYILRLRTLSRQQKDGLI